MVLRINIFAVIADILTRAEESDFLAVSECIENFQTDFSSCGEDQDVANSHCFAVTMSDIS